MGTLSRRHGMTALDFEGQRFDLGSKLGFLSANVYMACRHPEVGDDFKEYLKKFMSEEQP